MSPEIKVEYDEGELTFLPGLGTVPSSPRGRPDPASTHDQGHLHDRRRSYQRHPSENSNDGERPLVHPFNSWRASLDSLFPTGRERRHYAGERRQELQPSRRQAHDIRSRSRSPGRELSENALRVHRAENPGQSLFVPDDEFGESSADPCEQSSYFPEPTPPTVNRREPSAPCQCPINISCPRKGNELLDCRVLAAEWKAWMRKQYDDVMSFPSTNPGRVAPDDLLVVIISYCDNLENYPRLHRSHLENFRNMTLWIHEISKFDLTAGNPVLVQVLNRLSQFLDVTNHPALRSKGMPEFIREDLTIFFRKWNKGDLLCDSNRGLNIVTDSNGESHLRLDKSWPHYQPASFYGEGNLVNGQVSFSRLQMLRDGFHSHQVAGVSGSLKKGAYSIVVVADKAHYADVDNGHELYYIGPQIKDKESDPGPNNVRDEDFTDGNDRDVGLRGPEPHLHTRWLMKSLETGTPVRVIRSRRLRSIVEHRPKSGLRYDGLYKITEKTLMKKKEQIWSFKLVRLPGQGPLRGLWPRAPLPSQGKRDGRHLLRR